jgi:N-acetylglucosamine malate deacetylase 1
MKLDILAFGAHADDVEIGMAGTIAQYTKSGHSVGICDLTEAELSSNGTVQKRKEEARQAADILGIDYRTNLQLPDRGLFLSQDIIKKVTSTIRATKPSIVFAPYFQDRHPDHGKCAEIVKEAVFNAGIRKYEDEQKLSPHRVQSFYYYFINGFHRPDFVIDITNEIDKKRAALQAFKSQFTLEDNSVQTPLTDGYVETVINRERVFGKEVGVTYAEGFKSDKPIIMPHLFGVPHEKA